MLNEKVVKLLVEQVKKEFDSAYLYLDFANYYDEHGLDGFANWFEVQAQEERDHAMMIRRYLLDNGEKVRLLALDSQEGQYESPMIPLQSALEHERFVTASIHEIYHAASEVRDYRTMEFLDWFVAEQAEEEKSADELVRKMELFGSDGKGLYALNQELLSRVHVPAADGPEM